MFLAMRHDTIYGSETRGRRTGATYAERRARRVSRSRCRTDDLQIIARIGRPDPDVAIGLQH